MNHSRFRLHQTTSYGEDRLSNHRLGERTTVSLLPMMCSCQESEQAFQTMKNEYHGLLQRLVGSMKVTCFCVSRLVDGRVSRTDKRVSSFSLILIERKEEALLITQSVRFSRSFFTSTGDGRQW